MTAEEQLQLAKDQLERVQNAASEPDWKDLSLYGFYCLENAVCAAATHAGIHFSRSHPEKIKAADRLSAEHGFSPVSALLMDLNDARKAAAYGDIDSPELDAEDVVSHLEQYVKEVEAFLAA
ncbi:MAG: hypothetical protein ACLQPD_01720 [Desulfomonilaceae bacterium]